jgi:threonine aldolase
MTKAAASSAPPVDLRSDTLTTPTAAMRDAMKMAVVGDDVYGEDVTVRGLEGMSAELLGMEAALFVPSGTMGNVIALLLHARPGQRVLAPHMAHLVGGESGAGAAIAGVQLDVLPTADGLPSLHAVEEALQPRDYQAPPAGLLVLENTHSLAGGRVLREADMARLGAAVHRAGLPLHLDGARIFNAAAYLGADVRALVAPADTVMFSLSKGLAAPVGSMLCGSRAAMVEGRRYRKMLGGGMRQAGVIAAAGIVALETMIDRLGQDHDLARELAEGVAKAAPDSVDVNAVQTNMVMVDWRWRGWTADVAVSRLAEHGVRCLAVDRHRTRFVTHKDVTASDVQAAVAAVAELAETP